MEGVHMVSNITGEQPRRDRGATISGSVQGMHAADCSIWDVPAGAQPDEILADGIEREEVAAYLSAARPLYDAAKRCVGQLSGLLLLLQTNSLDRQRDGVLLASVRAQLTEAGERLRALKAPPSAARHHAAVGDLLMLLGRIAARLDRLGELVDPASPDLDVVVDALFAAQRGLHVVSTPKGGLTPVDFDAACCNCRRPTKN
jgi:hypothetical protein